MKNRNGQYFTTNNILKEYVYKFIKNNPLNILEPSVGRGDLLELVVKNYKNINIDMYEIDNSLEFLNFIDKEKIIYKDFLLEPINKKYDTIIGNPPYLKKNNNNLYIEFVKKCFKLLNENGELIFITPSDFFKLTSSANTIIEMLENGSFTDIFYPNNEKLFKNASIDVIIFRYCKNKNLINFPVNFYDKYNNKNLKYLYNNNGFITFENNLIDRRQVYIFEDLFDIYVGCVSGKEDIFKNEILGNIEVINNFNSKNKYIFINKFPSGNKNIDDFLYSKKEELIKRKIRKFNEKNWYEWGAIRNLKAVENNLGKNCIYINTLSRKKEISFVSKVMFFSANLLLLIPKNKDVCLEKICSYINSDDFKSSFLYSDRFKISHRQLSKFFIPKGV